MKIKIAKKTLFICFAFLRYFQNIWLSLSLLFTTLDGYFSIAAIRETGLYIVSIGYYIKEFDRQSDCVTFRAI